MDSTDNLQRLSVLIVDDEPFQRRVLREVLKTLGSRRITEADSGQLAMLKVAEYDYDLILSDVQMPGMNGLELLRQIRTGQTPRPRDTRFIIVTSFSNAEVLGAAMSLDVNGFLVKPIRIGVVREKLERAVQEAFQPRAQQDYESVVTDLPSLEDAQRDAGAAPGARLPAGEKSGAGKSPKRIPIVQARGGMQVAKDLVAKNGTVLIPAGTILTELFINRMWDLSEVLVDEFVDVFSGYDENKAES